MRAYTSINALALDAFDRLAEGGVEARTYEAEPFLARYRTVEERAALIEQLDRVQATGQDVKCEVISRQEAWDEAPALSGAVRAALRIHGQRYLNPPEFMDALAASVRERGGEICENISVQKVREEMGGVTVVDSVKPRSTDEQG